MVFTPSWILCIYNTAHKRSHRHCSTVHAPKGGIGLPLFSTQAQQDKLAMLSRAMYGDTRTKASMVSMLERGVRASYTLLTITRQQLCVSTSPKLRDTEFVRQTPQKTLWTQSVSEWLAIDGRSLYRHGIASTGTPCETIIQHYESKQLPLLPDNIASPTSC